MKLSILTTWRQTIIFAHSIFMLHSSIKHTLVDQSKYIIMYYPNNFINAVVDLFLRLLFFPLSIRCFVGKRHLEKAIQGLKNELNFEITWKPFFLNIDTPESGIPLLEYLGKRYGPQAAKAAADGTSSLTKAGQSVVSILRENNKMFIFFGEPI